MLLDAALLCLHAATASHTMRIAWLAHLERLIVPGNFNMFALFCSFDWTVMQVTMTGANQQSAVSCASNVNWMLTPHVMTQPFITPGRAFEHVCLCTGCQ